MRDLGAVPDHEEPPAPSGERAVASQDHQRSVVMRRRNEPGAMGLPSFMFLSPMSALQHIADLSQTSRGKVPGHEIAAR
jgi:hypothetical protein